MPRFSPGVRYEAPGPLDFSGLQRSLESLADTRFRNKRAAEQREREQRLDAERREAREYERGRDTRQDQRQAEQDRNRVIASGGTPFEVATRPQIRDMLPTQESAVKPLVPPKAGQRLTPAGYLQFVGGDAYVVDPTVAAGRQGLADLARQQPLTTFEDSRANAKAVEDAMRGRQNASGALTALGGTLPDNWQSLPLGQLEELVEMRRGERDADLRARTAMRIDANRAAVRPAREPKPVDFDALADSAIEASQGDPRKAADLLTRDPSTRDVFTQGMTGRHLQAAAERYRQATSPRPGTIRPATDDDLTTRILRDVGIVPGASTDAPAGQGSGRRALTPEERQAAKTDPGFRHALEEIGYTAADWQSARGGGREATDAEIDAALDATGNDPEKARAWLQARGLVVSH